MQLGKLKHIGKTLLGMPVQERHSFSFALISCTHNSRDKENSWCSAVMPVSTVPINAYLIFQQLKQAAMNVFRRGRKYLQILAIYGP